MIDEKYGNNFASQAKVFGAVRAIEITDKKGGRIWRNLPATPK